MKVNAKFDHYNCNVFDLQRSLSFYEKALNLHIHHQQKATDGSYIITFLTNPANSFLLEITWLRDWEKPYAMGDNEQHLAMRVPAGEYEQTFQYHKENGWVCYENPGMGIYFIEDPDGYWIEILPAC
ncbi:MAG: VOC family protein [Dysgonamonadaceae bacterium]|jgi:lactoylglutathione lyase|nr:VOC family protein [Dysgonamonadaceae bacterium]